MMQPDNKARDQDRAKTEDTLAQHQETLKELFPLPDLDKARKKKKRPSTTLTLLALIAAGVIWLDPAYHTESFTTMVGQRASIALADGSHITLNTNTQLDVSWHLRTRHVALHQGQALFDVAKATYRPFTVAAAQADIKVLGTHFDVRRDDDQVTVAVAEGVVRVRSHAADGFLATTLIANQQLMVRADGSMGAPASINPATSLAWLEGKLVFEQTPLEQVIAEIQRYRREPIHLNAQAAGKLKLSGTFSIDRSDELFRLLPDILPVSVMRDADGSVVISAK